MGSGYPVNHENAELAGRLKVPVSTWEHETRGRQYGPGRLWVGEWGTRADLGEGVAKEEARGR